MVIKLPESVNLILTRLNDCGYESYVVGGCVRDYIRGAIPHDWDLCTSALPEQVLEVFKDYKIIPTGLQHGTVTIVIDDEQFEVTTFRIDGEYEDNRHPKEVSFTSSLKEDLSRRDFTINAMAYNPYIGLVDYFGGEADIENGIIRCVGNPDDRFNEDALRMMRAVRFATVLNYKIEPQTLESIYKNKELLKNVSIERINSEFMKAIKVSFKEILADLIQVVVPELTNCMLKESVAIIKVSDIPLYTKLALIFNFDKKEEQKAILKRLKFDNKTIKNIQDTYELIFKFKTMDYVCKPKICLKMILNQNEDVAFDVIEGIRCTSYLDPSAIFYTFANILHYYLPVCKKECYKISQLAVNGNDIASLGIYGKDIGDMLEKLLMAVISDKVNNEYYELMEYSKFLLKIQY